MENRAAVEVLTEARRLVAGGRSIIPVQRDGSKAPTVPWKPYQQHRASEAELTQWFGNGARPGLAIIAGAVSGNAEVIDFDNLPAFAEWRAEMRTSDPELLDRLAIVETPDGGRHIWYRCETAVGGNQKLARRPKEDGGWEVLIETRGEGGYAIVPPSPAACHPSGKPYELTQGDLADLPVLTAVERDALLTTARALNTYLDPADLPRSPRRGVPANGDDLSPGDDYNRRGQAEFPKLLVKHGWALARTSGETTYWKRPGGEQRWSASLDKVALGVFYVFSTNAFPFEAEKSVDLFGAYCRLEHGGDFSAAGRALIGLGYGSQVETVTIKGPSGKANTNGAAPEGECGAAGEPEDAAHPFFRFFRDRCGWESGTFSPNSAFSADSQESHIPPPMREAAFYGLAGDFVRAWELETEACREALLAQFLSAVGSIMGPGPRIRRAADFHMAKLNVCLVGLSSDGGKGSSLSPVFYTLKEVDPSWYAARFGTAVSGEGIVKAVRDETRELKAVKKNGNPTGEMVEEVTDSGAAEKRLFIAGTEFSGVLKACQRQGCTLSDVIRMAWDIDFLQVPTKNFPYRATGCHVTVCGHITPADLARYLSPEDRKNGFANRFLWCASRRVRSLPRGGNLPNLSLIVNRLNMLTHMWGIGEHEFTMSDSCESVWAEGGLYEALRDCAKSDVGDLVSRAAPYVLRIALVYAWLDDSNVIRAGHLAAALAVWEYSERSVHKVFARGLGNPTAEFILRGLKACGPNEGPTRTQIGRVFGNKRAQDTDRVDEALQILKQKGLAKASRVETTGRYATRWGAADGTPKGNVDWGWFIESLVVAEKGDKADFVPNSDPEELRIRGNKPPSPDDSCFDDMEDAEEDEAPSPWR